MRAPFVATSALVVAVVFVASCSSSRVTVGPNPPTTQPATDGIKTVTIDSGSSDVLTTPEVALYEVVQACGDNRNAVRLDLRQGDIRLVHVFDCATARHRKALSAAQLVDLVANRHDAAHRADLVIALTHELGITAYSRDSLIWGIGTGVDGCYHVADASFHRQELAVVMLAPPPQRETPLHWTKVEAARFAGTCPTQLGAFFDSVAAAGQPVAANEVRAEMAHLGISS